MLAKTFKIYLEPAFEDVPQLFAHSIAWVFDFEAPSLGNNLLSRERSLGMSPSRVRPPFLHGIDVCLVELVLMVY